MTAPARRSSRWLEQTKRAKADMESLGFKWRRDFTVKTPFDRSRGGYGRTRISTEYEAWEAIAAKAAEIAAMHYDVWVYYYGERVAAVSIEENWNGQVRIIRTPKAAQ